MTITKDEIAKEKILIHAQKLFLQYGLKKTTMDEIANECKKAKSTLYHYFKSKEEVFEAVVSIELKELRKVVKIKMDQEVGLKNKINTYFIEFHNEIAKRLNLYRIIKHELANQKYGREQFNNLMKFETQFFNRLLEDAYDAGELTKIKKEDILFFSEIMIAAFFGIVRYSIETESGIDEQKLRLTTNAFIPRIFE